MRVSDSRTAILLKRGSDRFRAAVDRATITHLYRRASDIGTGAFQTSLTGGFVSGTERAIRASWLYRWLTAEPDSDIVVIDLRETMTIGPILAVLERLLTPTSQYWRNAQSRTMVSQLQNITRSRPVQVLSTVVLTAIIVNLTSMFVLGTPSASSIGIRLVLGSLALAGTRVRKSADELAQMRVFRIGTELLEPPEPSEPAGSENDQR